jgi:hypothetical protein
MLPLSDFKPSRRRLDGHDSWCRTCVSNHRKEVKLRKRLGLPVRPSGQSSPIPERDRWREQMRRHRSKYPERAKARNLLSKAVQHGKIARPAVCEQCGVECRPEAHHPDYSEPLNVRWLCKACHVHTGRTNEGGGRHDSAGGAI